MWNLIVWIAFCTATDLNCPTGDFIHMGTYGSHVRCEEVRTAWVADSELHRGACYWTEKDE